MVKLIINDLMGSDMLNTVRQRLTGYLIYMFSGTLAGTTLSVRADSSTLVSSRALPEVTHSVLFHVVSGKLFFMQVDFVDVIMIAVAAVSLVLLGIRGYFDWRSMIAKRKLLDYQEKELDEIKRITETHKPNRTKSCVNRFRRKIKK